MSNRITHDITCTVCGKQMDHTVLRPGWVVVPVLDGDAYACSTLCGLRLGHIIAEQAASDPEVRTRDTLPEVEVAAALPLN